MKNILEVIRFEVLRSIKKPSFWLAALILPVMMGFYILIVSLSGYNAGEAIVSGNNLDSSSIAFFDDANYIKNTKYTTADGEEKELIKVENRETGIKGIKEQKYDVFFYLPKDFYRNEAGQDNHKIEIYTAPEKIKILDDYSVPISNILSANAVQNISPADLSVITHNVDFKSTSFDRKDGHVVEKSELVSKIIAPAIAMLCFYLLICVLGNRLVAAMTEEKENRISELLLTSLSPDQLIRGKVISMMILGLLQLIILLIPIIILFIFAKSKGFIPSDFILHFNALATVQYGTLLIASYLLFTSFCILVGVVCPSAKDANNFAGVFIILFILPMIFLNVFMNYDNSVLMNFLSYFPPSAPIALMFRGVFGTINNIELTLGIVLIAVVACLIMKLAANIYRHNALGFNVKINLKKLMSSPRKSWKN